VLTEPLFSPAVFTNGLACISNIPRNRKYRN
jgi:hypothetical protein